MPKWGTKAFGRHDRRPLVCAAPKIRQVLERELSLQLVEHTGPPSGQSTTVTFTYEILDDRGTRPRSAEPLLRLRGIGKELFDTLGGGEAFLVDERKKLERGN